MRRRGIASALVLLGWLTAATSPAHAGPWNRDWGSAYLKAGLSYFNAQQSFTMGVATGLAYEAYTYNLYAEIGLPHRFTFVMDLPYVVARNASASGFTYGNNTLGDSRLEVDFQLLDEIALSLGVEVKIPLYGPVSEQASNDLIEVDDRPYPATNFPDVGDANVDVTPKVLFGWSFWPEFPSWLTSELGYRIRTDGFADGIWGSLGLGTFVWPGHIALGFYSNGVVNVQRDPNPEVQATRQFIYLQGYALFTGFPGAPDLGLTVSVGGIPVAESASEGMDVGVALSYDL